jgi:hypothetical protein
MKNTVSILVFTVIFLLFFTIAADATDKIYNNHWSWQMVQNILQENNNQTMMDLSSKDSITRNEMAKILHQLLASGHLQSKTDSEKLLTEYQPELNNLASRLVALQETTTDLEAEKINWKKKLEAHEQKINVGGEARVRFENWDDGTGRSSNRTHLRSRFNIHIKH